MFNDYEDLITTGLDYDYSAKEIYNAIYKKEFNLYLRKGIPPRVDELGVIVGFVEFVKNLNTTTFYQWKTGANDSCTKCKELNGRVFKNIPDRVQLAHFGCKCDIIEIDAVLANDLIEEHKAEIKKRDEVVVYLKESAKVQGEDGKWYDPITGTYEEKGKYGDCARYVRRAIEENTDLKIGQHGSAYNYEKPLEYVGFVDVYNHTESSKVSISKSYKPKQADVIIIQPTKDGKHKHGHIAMFDGTNWVSDFVQNTMHGLSGYKLEDLEYTIYRNPKWQDWD
jgi:hypothetical protein